MRRISDHFPRVFITGLRGGAGKTTLSLGIISAWRKQGLTVAPFKKGPDYIDAGWLALAAGRPCFNLDTFLYDPSNVPISFVKRSENADISVIEGNRGLFDGIDVDGKTSSAEVARLVDAPVVLIVDVTKSSRTVAAVVSGCAAFDPDLRLAGVILNRVAGSRHEANIRRNVEHHCGLPVLGAVPRMKSLDFPERHMGLVPTPEHDLAVGALEAVKEMAEKYVDLDALKKIAQAAPPIRQFHPPPPAQKVIREKRPKIGIIKDSAFQFYYPDNIEALTDAGAETVFIDSCRDAGLPDGIHALYIGGGFPETHAEMLADNAGLRKAIKAFASDGMPVYAECGGLIYLGESMILNEKSYPMTGVLPAVFGLSGRPQGLGYTEATVVGENPFFPVGETIRGHEFRYSKVLKWSGAEDEIVLSLNRGSGFLKGRDGIHRRNVFAAYTHIHALGVPKWAARFTELAAAYAEKGVKA